MPLIFYTPDTQWGGGVSGLFTFNIGSDTTQTKRSMVLPGFAYTTLRQLLIWGQYQLYFGHQKYWVTGEVDYFDYVYNYFGIGNGQDPEYMEKYDSKVGRLRLNVMRRIGKGLYLGPSYSLDIQSNEIRDSMGLLITESPAGYMGGRMSSVGIAANFDSRDHVQYPTRGWLVESDLRFDHKVTGSEFECIRTSVNASRYLQPVRNQVIALNAGVSTTWGRPSYIQMSYLGGPDRLRGYFEGQYRDHNAAWLQAEYRSPFLWRIGAVGFAGLGTVWGRGKEWNPAFIRPNVGAGLRFRLDKIQKVNLRFDFGLGRKASGFYLTFSEAF